MIKKLIKKWYIVLFVLIALTAAFILVAGIVSGSKMKKNIDGLTFSYEDKAEHVVRKYSFSGNRITVKNISTDTGEVLKERETRFWIRKNPPGKNGIYYVSWSEEFGFSGGARILVFDENGEICGLGNIPSGYTPDSVWYRE